MLTFYESLKQDIKYNVFYIEDIESYCVQVNLAGYNKEYIEASIKNDKLVIQNKNAQAEKNQGEKIIEQFTTNEPFTLVIPFRYEIESTPEVQNFYKDGILNIFVKNKKEKELRIKFI